MAENFLESYLVRLGFAPDLPSYRKFDDVLRLAEGSVEHHVSGITESVLKMQAGLLGGFLSLSGAIATMADKVAMADQGYRLMGLRMMMTTESARKLSMITDGLGASLDQIVWDPELHRRALIMSSDIDRLTEQLGPNFEKNMLHIRDLRFEFTRLGVELKFLGMGFVSDLFEKLGINIKTVSGWVDKFGENLPQLANKLSTDAVPVLKDTWTMFKELGAALKEFGVLFTNVIGLLSGDPSIEGAAFSFDKIANAIEHVLHWGADLFRFITKLETSLAHFANGVGMLFERKWGQAGHEFMQGLGGVGKVLENPMVHDTLTGAAGGAVIGSVVPGVGTITGAIGGGIGGLIVGLRHQDAYDTGRTAVVPSGNSQIERMIEHIANAHNVNPALALGIAQQESGFNAKAYSGAGAIGLMQLMPATARGLGVDPNDAQQNAEGGVRYIGSLLERYHGNQKLALAAYNAGPGAVDHAVSRFGSAWLSHLPEETQRYVPSVMAREANFTAQLQRPIPQVAPPASDASMPSAPNLQVHVGTISIMQPNLDAEGVKRAVAHGIRDGLHRQTQVDLAQLAPAW